MKGTIIEEITIVAGTTITFLSYLLSSLSIDLVKDFITIIVGLATATYTIIKTIGEIKKSRYYRRIERERKKDEKKSF